MCEAGDALAYDTCTHKCANADGRREPQSTQSTVALAKGMFSSLCVRLFIGSQALTQMCSATVLPAWVHMLLFLLHPLLVFLILKHTVPPVSRYYKAPHPLKTTCTPSWKVRGQESRVGSTVRLIQGAGFSFLSLSVAFYVSLLPFSSHLCTFLFF